jgi:hypothetical protein
LAKKAGVKPKRVREKYPRSRSLRQKVAGFAEPKNERDLKFCERYLVHRSQMRAYREAGFSENSAGSAAHEKYKQFAAYLDGKLRAIDAIVVTKISYERADLLDAMAAIALANPQDYLEQYTIINEKGESEHRIGMKDLRSLPRNMAAAIEEFHCDPATGRITYRMPSIESKTKMLKILAENTGAIKKDVTEHRHLHLHLKGIPTATLEQAEAQLIRTLGPEKVRLLLGGMTEEDQIG